MAKVLEIKNLTKKYGNKVILDNISFSLEKGKVCGFLGPNGAGKTTTMKIIVDLLEKDGGQILYDEATKISYLQDVPQFYEFYTISEYLEFLLSLNDNNDLKKIDEVLKLVGLTKEKDKVIKRLSRGLRQRLGIAASIINDPDILILDEPVSALDPIGRKEIFDLINKLKGKMSIIFSSHILSDAERICDQIIIIDGGKILLDKKVSEISISTNKLIIEFMNDEDLDKFKKKYGKEIEVNSNLVEIESDDISNEQLIIFDILLKNKICVNSIDIKKQGLEDIFVSEVSKNEKN